jgi:hypothetical protein
MFDAAIGPRLEANSLRMRRVFSAAGTFALAAESGRFAAAAIIVPDICPPGLVGDCVRDSAALLSGIPYLSLR